MKLIFNSKKNLDFEKFLPYTLILFLAFLCFHSDNVQQALGAESKGEPNISLKVQNQPLSEVLKKISLATGFKFKLNDQWSRHPVNASIENMPLHRVLKHILRGLNHAIIYESDKNIKIVVYDKVDSRRTDSYPIQSFSPQIQDYQQESAPSPESSPEEADDSKKTDDSSEDADSSESTQEKSAESEDSSVNEKKESSEETGAAASKESNQDSGGQSENVNEQNEQKNAAEEAPSENAQKQN